MITTKKLAPTDTKGTRISATDGAKRIVIAYDHALDSFKNHLAAARLLAAPRGWTNMVADSTPTGYVFLNARFTVEV